SATKRMQSRLKSAASRLRRRSHCSNWVLRCMRMTMQRSARVSGRRPMEAMILGQKVEKGRGADCEVRGARGEGRRGATWVKSVTWGPEGGFWVLDFGFWIGPCAGSGGEVSGVRGCDEQPALTPGPSPIPNGRGEPI